MSFETGRLRERSRRYVLAALAAPWSFPTFAAERPLADLTLEELMNEPVTSVSRKAEPLGDAAAAVSVISNDDLRRSGVTSITDALRLVPGIDVGALNASQYALSVRGFNHLYSNKLLVLVDGRAVYNPLFAGVYWDLQQPLLDDIERIEIIRGPGATLWGANAVNGVINIITRQAQDTEGGLAYAGAGNMQRFVGGARYGASLTERTAYRISANALSSDDYYTGNGSRAADRWRSGHAGMRVDSALDERTQLMWQADASSVDLDAGASNGYAVSTLGRWTHSYSSDANIETQVYYDRTYRNEITRAQYSVDTLDFSLQHAFSSGGRHAIIWGSGYRFVISRASPTNPQADVRRPRFDLQLPSLFVQDDVTVIPDRLLVTAGVKLEHNDFTGTEIQPNLRLRVHISDRQMLWAAESRAVRTPDIVESRDMFAVAVGAPLTGPDGRPYVPTLVGTARPRAEVLRAHEAGYRVKFSARASLDIAAFYNEYHDLITYGPVTSLVPGTPVGIATLPLMNLLSARTHGVEVSATAAPREDWRLTGTYSLLRGSVRGQVGLGPALSTDGPEQQATLRACHDMSRRVSFTAQLRYVDSLPGVAPYTTADAHIDYRSESGFELSLLGQNLFQRRHAEQASAFLETTTEVPRSLYAKVLQRF